MTFAAASSPRAADDTPAAVRKRLQDYHDKTAPILELFSAEGADVVGGRVSQWRRRMFRARFASSWAWSTSGACAAGCCGCEGAVEHGLREADERNGRLGRGTANNGEQARPLNGDNRCRALFGQAFQLDVAELDGVALGLEGDGAAGDFFLCAGGEQLLGVGVFFVELRSAVFEDRLAVDLVADQLVAVDFDFDGDPLADWDRSRSCCWCNAGV